MQTKTYNKACDYIEHLSTLRSGWDGYSGCPIKDEAINKAIVMVTIYDVNGVDFDDVYIKPIDSGDIEISLRTNEIK